MSPVKNIAPTTQRKTKTKIKVTIIFHSRWNQEFSISWELFFLTKGGRSVLRRSVCEEDLDNLLD